MAPESKCSSFIQHNRNLKCSIKFSSKSNHFPCQVVSSCFNSSIFGGIYSLRLRRPGIVGGRAHLRLLSGENNDLGGDQGEVLGLDLKSLKILLKQGVFISAMLCCLLVFLCERVLVAERVVNALLLRNAWPKFSMVLKIFKEQGVILIALLGLSAFFSMVETSITTLWPWKVRKLAEKESKDAVFRMLHSDGQYWSNCFSYRQSNTIFGEAGVSAATGVMTGWRRAAEGIGCQIYDIWCKDVNEPTAFSLVRFNDFVLLVFATYPFEFLPLIC